MFDIIRRCVLKEQPYLAKFWQMFAYHGCIMFEYGGFLSHGGTPKSLC